MSIAPRDRSGFQVAIFCALTLEAENVQSVFDICWEDQDIDYGKARGDQNTYTTGAIGKHNVVLIHMPRMGGNSAACAAAGLRSSFLGIRLALVVGICGIVPVHPKTKKEIILGDIIISTAVVQYNFGRQYPNGFQRKNEVENSLGQTNPEIQSFMNMMSIRQNRERFNRKLEQLVQSKEFQYEVPPSAYPGTIHDRLYEAIYVHQHRSASSCDRCITNLGTCTRNCDELGCEDTRLIARNRLTQENEKSKEAGKHIPVVHLGRFGSANIVMKSGLDRDRISAADEVCAFEMEGAGIWEQYPTVMIKAGCDYSDSHKDKRWQDYAAAMAAACLKVFLKQWATQEPPLSQYESTTPVWHIPFDPIPGFIGREGELQKLGQKLFDSQSRRIVCLLGLGGVGKSRLALELVYQTKLVRPQYSIFWIQASERLTFENDLLEIGRKLEIPGIDDEKADVKALVKQRLSVTSSNKWLLVLDNADDEVLWGGYSTSSQQKSSLLDHLPKTTNGSILVTTRTRRVASFLAGKEVIKLGAITQDEGADLFVSKLGDPDLATDRNALTLLVNKLANLPLAIVQAASFVDRTEIPVQAYLNLLDQPESEVVKLLSKDFGDGSRYPDAINPVATTWMISFKHIQKRHPMAADFLSAIACLHDKAIPLSLLPVVESTIDRIEALAVLIGYSFITKQSSASTMPDREEIYNVHRLVQLAARSWLRNEGIFHKWTNACIIQLAQLFPTGDYKDKSLWTMYLPHAQCVCVQNGRGDLKQQYDLLERMGLCYMADGKYDEAVKIHTAVVNWREQTPSASDDSILEAYNNLGVALKEQGDFSKAESCLLKAVSNRVGVLGKSHPDTLISMNNLANVLGRQGKYIEAGKLHREVLRSRETLLGKSHPNTLISMNNLALALEGQTRYVEAGTIHRRALRLKATELGQYHPSTLTSMNNLASVLNSQGKYVEAAEMHREVLQLRQTVLGKSHPDTLTSMNNLAQVLTTQTKYVEAEKMHREVLQLFETVLGQDHPTTLVSMSNLAFTLREQNRIEEAMILISTCTNIAAGVLGLEHPDTQAYFEALDEWSAVSQQESEMSDEHGDEVYLTMLKGRK